LVTVRLTNVGKDDISSTMFDQEKPVVLDFRTPVLALLEPDRAKDGLLPVELDGNTVTVGPGLFKSGQELDVVALAEGGGRFSIENPLENVKLVRGADSGAQRPRFERQLIVVLGLALALLTLLITLAVFISTLQSSQAATGARNAEARAVAERNAQIHEACVRLAGAASAESNGLEAVSNSVHVKNGKVTGYNKSKFDKARLYTLDAVDQSVLSLRSYAVLGQLPKENESQRKFAEDFTAIRKDLDTLRRELPDGNPYDAWNQLADYRANSDAIATMTCP
jgi:hypothetical protein